MAKKKYLEGSVKANGGGEDEKEIMKAREEFRSGFE